MQVLFDPDQVPYEDQIELFWKQHDPTQFNRQGPDIGTQYRSAIFTHSKEQQELAEASKNRLEFSGRYTEAIVTEITPLGPYYKAEEYHQRYLEKGGRSAC